VLRKGLACLASTLLILLRKSPRRPQPVYQGRVPGLFSWSRTPTTRRSTTIFSQSSLRCPRRSGSPDPRVGFRRSAARGGIVDGEAAEIHDIVVAAASAYTVTENFANGNYLDTWNEDAIQKRAGQLADLALEVWAAPVLDAAILAGYQPTKSPESGGHTISDHPHLLAPGLRDVFEAFRKEVLALDPCVSEDFMKLYVAYKAETNFVDVVPLAKRLRLTLNMPFAEIGDPKGLCKDVTNLGRWGNGDVEVTLNSLHELPYIMGLVRQSYERQMGDEGQP
jgi:predicted transport protein